MTDRFVIVLVILAVLVIGVLLMVASAPVEDDALNYPDEGPGWVAVFVVLVALMVAKL